MQTNYQQKNTNVFQQKKKKKKKNIYNEKEGG
jgi:hypothetical protein